MTLIDNSRHTNQFVDSILCLILCFPRKLTSIGKWWNYIQHDHQIRTTIQSLSGWKINSNRISIDSSSLAREKIWWRKHNFHCKKVTRLRVKTRIQFVFLGIRRSGCAEFQFFHWSICLQHISNGLSNTITETTVYRRGNHKLNFDCVVPKREPNPGTVVGRFDDIGADFPRIKSWFTGFSGQNGFRTCKCLTKISVNSLSLWLFPFSSSEKKIYFFLVGWLRV